MWNVDSSVTIVFGTIRRMGNLNVSGRLRRAADNGDAFAQFELGLDLNFGTCGEQNFEMAAHYLTKAAGQGHQSAEGNLLLQHVLGQAKTYPPEVVFVRSKNRAESGDREAQNNFVQSAKRNNIRHKSNQASLRVSPIAQAPNLAAAVSVCGPINETNHQAHDHPLHEVSDPLLNG
jgi:TPR repeat protein